jgi:DNA-binding response OmpR family regulator
MQINDGSKIILLAEDDANDALATEIALRSAGVLNRIIHVLDGDEALAYLKGDGLYSDRREFPLPSIVLLDLKMPRMDGFRVLSWFTYQVDRKKFLVIVLSGHGELQHIKRAYELGANSFLIKPFHPAEIHNLVRVHPQYWALSPEFNPPRGDGRGWRGKQPGL